jgi:DnaK suppressor protein
MEELNSQQLQQLQQQLLQLKTELEEQLNSNQDATNIVELDQSAIGRVTRMDAIQQQSMAVSTRNKVRQRLQSINLALSRYKKEDYGYCKQCDETIAFVRLLAQPESSLCLSCQAKTEA